MKRLGKQLGFSLIELIVFIVVIALIAIGVIRPLSGYLTNSSTNHELSRALTLAQNRMAMLLAASDNQGFANFTDPCAVTTPPSICTATGYTISATITNGWENAVSNSNYKTITVTVSGAGAANLKTIVTRE